MEYHQGHAALPNITIKAHAGTTTAKSGLYEYFIRVLQDSSGRVASPDRSTNGQGNLLITGILDEPVSIGRMVTQGVAGLFVPKLCEYCQKKELIGFAIRKEIPPPHFNDFIAVVEQYPGGPERTPEGQEPIAPAPWWSTVVTMISTVFADDLLKLEQDLPWPVEMAIQRLAKDFRVIPTCSPKPPMTRINRMKLATVEDIIQPLKHPRYLNDFLVNSHVIAENVATWSRKSSKRSS